MTAAEIEEKYMAATKNYSGSNDKEPGQN